MQHRTPPRSPALLALAALLALLWAAPPAAPPARAQVAVAADPPALAVDLPLGERATRTVRLTGSGGAFAPAIYEARPPAPTLLAAGPQRAPLPQQAKRLDPQIAAAASAAPDGQADFLIVLRDQADLAAAYGVRDWTARGELVYRTLREHAERTQAPLRAALAARGLPFTPLWVVNAIRVRGSTADAQALAGRADVAALRASRTFAIPPAAVPATVDDPCSPDAPGTPVCWNIRQIGADRVWREFGVDGAGITVASIDTGVAFGHQALTANYRGRVGGGLDHSYNWFDPQGSDLAPADPNGHGTHTVATIVGRGAGTPAQPAVGVAPGASWVAAQGCTGFICAEFDLIAAAQWLLAPTDTHNRNPRPDLRPMIVSNSWGGMGGNDWYAGYTAAWRAAGIFPVFAAGNADASRSQACGTVTSPGDYPDVLQVGATDAADQVASFSLLGPTADGRTKPDFVAPGTHTSGQRGIYSAFPDSAASYKGLQGTSMATPHVAGVAALMWSANPALIGDYDATYAILRDTALALSDTRCGDPPGAPNSVYGHGRVDAYAAVARARVDVPWLLVNDLTPAVAADGSATLHVTFAADRVPGPGAYAARLQVYGDGLGHAPTTIEVTLTVAPTADAALVSGRVRSTDGGQPVAATVSVAGGLGVPTDATGAYTLTLSPGSYTLLASALSYLPAAQEVTLGAGERRIHDFALAPDQPRAAVDTAQISATLAFGEERVLPITLSNAGRRPLHYTADAPPAQFSVWRSDSGAPGAPAFAWVDLPEDASRLSLGADTFTEKVPLGIEFPFYSYILTETLVTSDGTLTFDIPYGYAGPTTRCLPADELGFYAIAPLRADFDPSRGGVVRYGTVNGGRTFVLSYEGIPRDDGPPDETYTFQALLHDDGRVVFQYKTLARRTAAMSAGIQRSPWEYQQIGCGDTLPVRDGLAVELRRQPSSAAWLGVSPSAGALLPGERATIQVKLTWLRPHVAGPYQAQVRLTSNDPLSPAITLPVTVTLALAPHEQALPYMFRP